MLYKKISKSVNVYLNYVIINFCLVISSQIKINDFLMTIKNIKLDEIIISLLSIIDRKIMITIISLSLTLKSSQSILLF